MFYNVIHLVFMPINNDTYVSHFVILSRGAGSGGGQGAMALPALLLGGPSKLGGQSAWKTPPFLKSPGKTSYFLDFIAHYLFHVTYVKYFLPVCTVCRFCVFASRSNGRKSVMKNDNPQ